MEALSRLVQRLRVSRLAGAVLIGLAVFAGYLFAGWVSGPRDTIQLAQICARVDYVNSLQEGAPTTAGGEREVRKEFASLVEQCRIALRDRAEEAD
jgi:hypothetical protein